MSERRYDIDWLRVLAIVFVFLYHCVQIFRPGEGYVVNNSELTTIVDFPLSLLDMIVMANIFLLSGAGTWYALGSRSNLQYLWERTARLLIPLYTVGMCVLLPISNYLWLRTNAGYQGSFWEMLPSYFAEVGDFYPLPSGLVPVPYPGHLWFLQFLFLTSILTLPLLRYLRTERGLQLIDLLAGWCHRRGGLLLLLVPVLLIRVCLSNVPGLSGYNAWTEFIEYMVYFLIGFILPADPRFSEGIKRQGWICLVTGLIGFVLIMLAIYKLGYVFYDEPFSLRFVLFQALYSLARCSWVIFILSLGMKYLNFNNKALAYGNEAVLPFYILHEPIVVLVGWFVISWNLAIISKLLIIIPASFAVSMILYDLIIRRLNVVRFLFGMRPKKKQPAVPAHPEGAAA